APPSRSPPGRSTPSPSRPGASAAAEPVVDDSLAPACHSTYPPTMTAPGGGRAGIALFPGDGIGPEVTAEAVTVLEIVAPRHGLELTFTGGLIGGAGIDARGVPRPPAELERARAADAVLLGAVGGPTWDDPAA